MKVKEVLDSLCGDLYITTGEDPNLNKAEIWVDLTGGLTPAEVLSNKVLDSDVYLMAVNNDELHVSLFWNRR